MVPEKEHLIFDLGLHIHIYAPVFTRAYILAHKWKHRLYIIFGHVKLSIIHYCWFHRHKKVHCENYSSLRLLWWMRWMSCGWVATVWKAAVHVEKINTPTFFCHVFGVSGLPESQCLVHKWKKWRLELRLNDKALTYLAFPKPCFGPWSHKFKKKKGRNELDLQVQATIPFSAFESSLL